MKRKKSVKRKPPRRRQVKKSPLSPLIQRRAIIEDDEVWEQIQSFQPCLHCYNPVAFNSSKQFDVRDKFCLSCRHEMPFKKWLFVRKLYRMLEDALNHNPPDNDITRGDMMQFVNGCYRALRYNKNREFLLDSISCGVDVAILGDPIALSQLMEIYDQIVEPKKKRRTSKKRRRLQKSRKRV